VTLRRTFAGLEENICEHLLVWDSGTRRFDSHWSSGGASDLFAQALLELLVCLCYRTQVLQNKTRLFIRVDPALAMNLLGVNFLSAVFPRLGLHVVDGGACARDELLRRGLSACSLLCLPYGEPVALFPQPGLCMVIAERALAALTSFQDHSCRFATRTLRL
jgi:hypothetical protein